MRLAAFRHGSAWTQLLESTGRDQQRRRSTGANDLVALDQSLDDRLALRGTPADPRLAGRLEFRLATQIDVRRQTNVRIITACLMAFPIRF